MYIIQNVMQCRTWETDSRTEALLYATLGLAYSAYNVYCPSSHGMNLCTPYDL